MEDKFLQLAKKLKALADQGVGGEKENAAAKLTAFMEKHGITMDQLGEDKRERSPFRVTKDQHKLFFQVAASVIGMRATTYWVIPGKRNLVKLETTKSEAIEIELKFRHYWKAYTDELKIFYSAFIQRNRIFSIDAKSTCQEPSEDDVQHAIRVLKMAGAIKKVKIHRELSD